MLGTVRNVSRSCVSVSYIPDPNDQVKVGESVAVNGCCLTVVSAKPNLRFELSEETLSRTSLGQLSSGDRVNLERAMKADGRFGGHIVQGHVDATGKLLEVRLTEQAHVMSFSYPAEYERYLIEKGSLAVDGISLTVVNPAMLAFEVWVIPHTWENTNLSSMKEGQVVNLEFDMVAKYLEKLVR